MTSLHQRLTGSLALGLGLLLLTTFAIIYPAARRWLTAEFDAALLAKARALTTLPEAGRRGVNLAFTERTLPEYERAAAPEYFQVWLGERGVQARSPSLGTNSLPLRTGPENDPVHWALTLPDGRPGRAVGIRFSLDDGTAAEADSFAVVFARDTLELRRTLRQLLAGLGLGGATLLGLMLWVARRATSAALQPVESLAREVGGIQAACLATRFDAGRAPAEVQPLVQQLNQLLERLETAFAREQRFAANAAHELLTPVSELRALAEAAAKWGDEPAATAQFTADVQETAAQMEQTIRALLALARAEAETDVASRPVIDLSALLREMQPGLEGRARRRQLELMWQVEPDISARGERTHCRTILSNLLDNAVAHCPKGGRIECRLEDHAGRFLLTLHNSNPGLSHEDVGHLFEPFWRKDAARSDRSHAGLGLPLVRALAERAGWEIEISLIEPCLVQVQLWGAIEAANKGAPARNA